jgi:biotin-dependent carboxylase-like uncharacterized protein
MIEIVEPGPFATVQDGGRRGYAAVGVPRSGAFDRGALALANRLVGNPPDAAAIEVTLGGLAVRLHTAATVALAGALCGGFDWGTPVTLTAGTSLRLTAPTIGLRSYLAVRGGFDVPPVLGSRSRDSLSGLGPAPLRAGDRLNVGTQRRGAVGGFTAAPAEPRRRLDVVMGPRDGWFTSAALAELTAATWTVRADSNRIGIRLDGPRLDRRVPGELPSEPMIPGSLQVPRDGRPILFGPDAPVTGGYPVIAVVRTADLDVAAQLRPGDVIAFRRVPGESPAR